MADASEGMWGRDLGSPQLSDLESLEDGDGHQDGQSEEKDGHGEEEEAGWRGDAMRNTKGGYKVGVRNGGQMSEENQHNSESLGATHML